LFKECYEQEGAGLRYRDAELIDRPSRIDDFMYEGLLIDGEEIPDDLEERANDKLNEEIRA